MARVLFVDDDDAARRGYAEYLTLHGHTVIQAETGERALTVAMTWQPDIVILDLGLPDIDGWEIARKLRAHATGANVSIIAFTGAELPHERASAMRAGCDRHIAKPCAPQELLQAIDACLGR